jgi:hypothetical protein
MTFEDIDDELKDEILELEPDEYIKTYNMLEIVREYMDQTGRDYESTVFNEAHTLLQLFGEEQREKEKPTDRIGA